ncbi:MAG: hypothetical protein M1825_005129 [Sarcosagium campestre]|nr:MAG: hypothetical protein M1825_005129 [Sarcosagium campestre]
MAGVKRNLPNDVSSEDLLAHTSPYMPMFTAFRDALDEHQDRRERIIKASRDITAQSKKMIFSLQRATQLKQPLPSDIASECADRSKSIAKLFTSLKPDLDGAHASRYARQISGGMQEFIEAVAFRHYIEHQTLITPAQATALLPDGIPLTDSDYLLGIFDLVGEMMRFAITNLARSGVLPGSGRAAAAAAGSEIGAADPALGVRDLPAPRSRESLVLDITQGTVLTDLQSFRTGFESLDLSSAEQYLAKEVDKKMEVMRTCVEKVEDAAYSFVVRCSERPVGWTPAVVG